MNTSCRECVYYPVEFKKKPCFNCARGDRFEAKTPPKTYADGIAQGRREAAEAYCKTICGGIYHKHPENEPCNLVKVILGDTASKKKGV